MSSNRVVILGGGFGGVYTAIHLQRRLRKGHGPGSSEVILVSKNNYFLMTPLLFEAGSGILEPRHAVSPLRKLLTGQHVRFVEAEVLNVDFARRSVRARAPGANDAEIYEIPYDQLVVALGGVTNKSLVPGSEHAIGFKTLGDAIFLRNHVIQLFERADVERDPDTKRALLTFVIIGAGLVGVELIGELTEFVVNLTRSYRHVNESDVRFELIEGGKRILGELEEDLAEYATGVLKGRGVSIRTDCRVKQIEPGKVHLPDGTVIPAETVVVATGVTPNPLIHTLDIEKDRKGKIVVDATMRSKSHPNVWALGDCASIPDPEGKPYPPLAQHALREARVLAGNIACALRGREGELKPFVYKSLGTLAALGHYTGVGRVMKVKIRGFVAWWVWRTYYLFQMPRWNRRFRIMLDWTTALLFKNDIVQLDLFGEGHPTQKRRLPGAASQPSQPRPKVEQLTG